MTTYWLTSKSTDVSITKKDLAEMAEVLNIGGTNFDSDWGLDPCAYYAAVLDEECEVDAGDVVCAIVDDLVDPQTNEIVTDALAWHYIDGEGMRHIDVGWNVIKSVGGGKFMGSGGSPYLSITSALSHEMNEDKGDPYTNGYALRANGYELIAQETSDPVESDGYVVKTTGGTECALSSYVLPAWLDPYAPEGTALDRMGTCKSPLSVGPGGYLVVIKTEGQSSEELGRKPLRMHVEWGEKVPEWRKKLRRPRLEKRRRLHAGKAD